MLQEKVKERSKGTSRPDAGRESDPWLVKAGDLIVAALAAKMTGQIVLHIKEGRIMEVQRTEVIKV